jgi:hypothetical protein
MGTCICITVLNLQKVNQDADSRQAGAVHMEMSENKRLPWRVYRQNDSSKLARTTRRPVSGDYILKSDAAEISETNNEILSNLEICENLTITSIYVYRAAVTSPYRVYMRWSWPLYVLEFWQCCALLCHLLTLWSLQSIWIVYTNKIRTSQETHYVSATEPTG